MKSISIIYRTLIYLKFIQIRYQIFYRAKKILRKLLKLNYCLTADKQMVDFSLKPFLNKPICYKKSGFLFLNQTLCIKNTEKFTFNWQKNNFGMLWDYNLNYMDFLLQTNMPIDKGLAFIEYFIKKLPKNQIGLHPAPIAIRSINWIKFLKKFKIKDTKIEGSLFAQLLILSKNIEYHLLANHLLEDAYGLLFGAFAFKNKNFYKKANKILHKELDEQINKDGGHFERTPMYHKILLERLLDCINLLQSNHFFVEQELLLKKMETKASEMIGWLKNMTFSDGSTPNFNDSTEEIAFSSEKLFAYAKTLGIKIKENKLSDSGYRKIDTTNYECIVNIGNASPSYQPGHAHADSLHFVIQASKKPFVVDTGISTYEKNKVRIYEKSTAAHNTVTVNNLNSSEVWGAFRMGRRAKVSIEKDLENEITASHNGYKKINTIHKRTWKFDKTEIEINDKLEGNFTDGKCYLHFAPNIKPILKKQTLYCQIANIEFSENALIEIETTKIPLAYNKFADNYRIVISFSNELKTNIRFL